METEQLYGGLFANLAAEDLALVVKIARPASFEAGREIFRLGEEARTIYLIETGKVALTHPLEIRDTTRDVTIEEKGEGAVLGWSALVPPHKLTLGARAASEVKLVGLDRPKLEELFAEHPRIRVVALDNLCRVIASRVALLEAMFLRNIQRWVTERFE